MPNGRVRNFYLAAAIAAGLGGVAYCWGWVTAAVHHLDTINWVNQVRASDENLSRDIGFWNGNLNAAAARDAKVAIIEASSVAVQARLANIEAEQQFQRHMLELLLNERGIPLPRRTPTGGGR